jgi:hypothetical protein
MKTTMAALASLVLFGVTLQSAFADAYVGQFVGLLEGEEYRLSIERTAGNRYEGELRVVGTRLAVGLRRFGEIVRGQIGSSEGYTDIILSVQGNALRLEDEDGKVILFRRVGESGAGGID